MGSSPTRADELVELAAVVRAHGLGGDLLLKLFNPQSQLLLELPRVILRDKAGAVRELEVRSCREHSGNMLLTLEGVRGREAAEALRGSVVCVRRDALPEPAQDEHYFVDLVGLTVVDQAGASIGRVSDVFEYPSVTCFEVTSDTHKLELPYTDRYVVDIDLEARVLRADHLDELEVLRTDTRKGQR